MLIYLALKNLTRKKIIRTCFYSILAFYNGRFGIALNLFHQTIIKEIYLLDNGTEVEIMRGNGKVLTKGISKISPLD